MGILYQTESFLSACISLVHEPDKPCSRQQPSCTNTRKELRRCVYRLGTIIQCIFCAQSGASIRLNFWKWSGESRYPGALSPVMKTFVPPFLPTRLTAPGSPRMVIGGRAENRLFYAFPPARRIQGEKRGLCLQGNQSQIRIC